MKALSSLFQTVFLKFFEGSFLKKAHETNAKRENISPVTLMVRISTKGLNIGLHVKILK